MRNKQDFHIEVTRNGFNDLLKDEIKEVEGLHNEINEIRATLARMQHGQEV